jgi:biopolymer transport protein TolQ
MFIFAANPFFDAYSQSDLFGKGIFIALFFLSVLSWVVILHKVYQANRIRRLSREFYQDFQEHKFNPLGMNCEPYSKERGENAYFSIYLSLKKYTAEVLNKNRKFGRRYMGDDDDTPSYLSSSDIDFLESHLIASLANQTKLLEKNLNILAIIMSLAPFLGLLGTVWGMLITLSGLQAQGGMNQMVLGGLSLALATTVIGLLDAIPALIGYNVLKQRARDFGTEMEGFTSEALATVEMQYRKVDVHG